MTLTSTVFFLLGLIPSMLIDRVGMIFLGYVPTTIWDQFVCLTIQLGHAAVMGILFAHLVPIIGSKYLVLKGSTFGALTWFLIFSVGSISKLTLFYNLPGLAVAANLFTSSFWGVIAALVLVWFERRSATSSEIKRYSSRIATPAYKHLPKEAVGDRANFLKLANRGGLPHARHKQAKSHRSFWSRLKFW